MPSSAHRHAARRRDRFVEAREQQRPRDRARTATHSADADDRRDAAPARSSSPKIEPNSTLTLAAPFAALPDVV